MDDNIWEYPFGDLDDDEEFFYHRVEVNKIRNTKFETNTNVQNTNDQNNPNFIFFNPQSAFRDPQSMRMGL